MPHIIVEYVPLMEDKIPALLQDLHETLAAQDIDMARIKTRATLLQHFIVGDKGRDGQMVHTSLLLLEGRNAQTLKQYGDALKEVLNKHIPEDCANTLEIREMVQDHYYL